MENRIERVDSIPLIIHWLMKMQVHKIIDRIYTPHKNWDGLSYGQLAVLFLTYVLYSLTHRLSGMESWLIEHKTTIERVTGWKLGDKDATDDRLGRMVEVFGEDDDKSTEFQLQIGQHMISAHELPTEIGRYDTTSFNVYHQSNNSDDGLLEFGHSKNYRPDLLQFKQGLGTLDPAGIPLITETISGNRADDKYYVPAWRRMTRTIGHAEFLFIADCKAASLETRAVIDKEEGYYLFPLPMTGDTPEILKELVLNPPEDPQEIRLEPKTDKEDKPRIVGVGFVVEKQMEMQLEDGCNHKWTERWMVTRSDAHAQRQKKAFKDRLAKADKKLNDLKSKKKERAAEFLARADKILKYYKVKDAISLEIKEFITHKKKYKGRGRPGPNSPYKMVKIRNLTLSIQHNDAVIDQYLSLAGWRIYVTNTSADRMSLNQSTQYYRNEWLVERGFHRLKKGSLPALPLFLRLPDRIKGLMMLLTVALQALTLIEYVSRRELENDKEKTISGLVPGNPKMKTNRPTAERLLSQFDNIHLLIQENETRVKAFIIEKLNTLQCRILSLLNLPVDIFDLSFTEPKIQNSS